jgi:hypothetical protein
MTITDLGPAATRLCAVIQSVADGDLARSTPCSEYAVGDPLDHRTGVTSLRCGRDEKRRRGIHHGPFR